MISADSAITAICIISFALTILNYSILCRSKVEELNWKVKETFYALLALMAIIISRIFLNVISCGFYCDVLAWAKLVLELIVILYILVFNVVLLRNILRSTMSQVSLCKDCLNIPFYIAVLWMVFERVRLNPEIADVVVIVAALAILAMLLKLMKYIKILSLIIEPANMQPSLMAYLVFMMFYLASILANIYEKAIVSNMYMVSFGIAGLSMVLLDFEFRKMVKIHLL